MKQYITLIIVLLTVLFSCDKNGEEYCDLPWVIKPTVAVFQNKIFVLSGQYVDKDSQSTFGGIYSSKNGKDWTLVSESPAFQSRMQTGVIEYNNKLWILGGFPLAGNLTGIPMCSDVWSSTNGEDWTLVTNTPGFGERYGHSVVIFNGKMWVIVMIQQ